MYYTIYRLFHQRYVPKNLFDHTHATCLGAQYISTHSLDGAVALQRTIFGVELKN